MNVLERLKHKIKSRINRVLSYLIYKKRGIYSQKEIQKKLRNSGMHIGENCHIYSDIQGPEPYLISLGNNVTISSGVNLITHDNSISKSLPEFTDIFGKIEIGDNCFIGVNSIILPGVKICKNTIIAAGSVVSKSIMSEGELWAGIPAKRIGKFEEFSKKWENYAFNTTGLSYEEKKSLLLSSDKLIKR